MLLPSCLGRNPARQFFLWQTSLLIRTRVEASSTKKEETGAGEEDYSSRLFTPGPSASPEVPWEAARATAWAASSPGCVRLQCAMFWGAAGWEAARGAGRAHTARSPPSLGDRVISSAGLVGAPFSAIPRLPDGFAGLGFDSSGRTTHPFPISHPSHAGVEVDGV